MTATRAADEWDHAAAVVKSAESHLLVADTHGLRAWADENRLMTRTLWPKVKRELMKQFGIDYDVLRERETDTALAIVRSAAADAPTVELFAAGDGRGRFAVVGVADDTAWFGTFHPLDTIYRVGDQDSADNSAAGKAVFLATKVRGQLGARVIRLMLHITNPTIDEHRLRSIAARSAVLLDSLDTTSDNPALLWCDLPGHRAWQEIRLDDLVVGRDGDVES